MKTLTATVLLTTLMVAILPAPAHATVICQSRSDHTFRASFPGFTCPSGFYPVY